jgi:uncharacterized protein YjaZ
MKAFFAFLLILAHLGGLAQQAYPADPARAQFVTSDLTNFYHCFDMMKKDSSINPFQRYYLDIGSRGLTDFIPSRIQSADHLLATVKKNFSLYDSLEHHYYKVKDQEKQCREAFNNLKRLYPEAVYPPVYFVIGALNSGGYSSEHGLIIGVERQERLGDIPYIVAHELIHFQQPRLQQQPTLLQESILEGMADFIGELISGKTINEKVYAYGERHADLLCKEFVQRMDSTDYNDWLYGTTHKDDRPNDLGYWIGYNICKRYFDNSTDKRRAIADMLTITDYKAFTRKSGYLTQYRQ